LTEGGPWISIGSSVVQEEVQSEEGESSDHFFLNFCLTLTQPTNGRQALIIPSSYDGLWRIISTSQRAKRSHHISPTVLQ
jgi:hypothetical protein